MLLMKETSERVTVYRISSTTPEDHVRALITISGGESVTLQSLVETGNLTPP